MLKRASIPQLLMPQMDSEDVQIMLKFCLHIVFWSPVATIVVRVRYGQVFTTCNLLTPRVMRRHRLV